MQKRPPAAYELDAAPTEFAPDFPIVFIPDNIVDDRRIRSVHVHDSLEIGVCHEGAGIFIIANKVLAFKAGDVVVINNHEAHRAQSRPGTSSLWSWAYVDVAGLLADFVMDFSLLDYSPFWGQEFINVFSPGGHPALCGAVEQIVKELRAREDRYRPVVRALVLYLMTLLHRDRHESLVSTHGADPTPLLRRVHGALTHISQHYGDRINLRQLAGLCNMSVPHFRRLFRKATGRNPLEYLMHLRLTMACVELKSTDKSAETVAADTGFPTFSCFLRKFKSVHGTTPHKWRRA